jgi:hypothetical protein
MLTDGGIEMAEEARTSAGERKHALELAIDALSGALEPKDPKVLLALNELLEEVSEKPSEEQKTS